MIAVCCAAADVEIVINQSFEILMFHDCTDSKIQQKMIKSKHVSSKVRFDKKERFNMITHAANHES